MIATFCSLLYTILIIFTDVTGSSRALCPFTGFEPGLARVQSFVTRLRHSWTVFIYFSVHCAKISIHSWNTELKIIRQYFFTGNSRASWIGLIMNHSNFIRLVDSSLVWKYTPVGLRFGKCKKYRQFGIQNLHILTNTYTFQLILYLMLIILHLNPIPLLHWEWIFIFISSKYPNSWLKND